MKRRKQVNVPHGAQKRRNFLHKWIVVVQPVGKQLQRIISQQLHYRDKTANTVCDNERIQRGLFRAAKMRCCEDHERIEAIYQKRIILPVGFGEKQRP